MPALPKSLNESRSKVLLERASSATVRVDADINHREPPVGGFFAAKTQLSQTETQRLYAKAAKLRPAIWDAQRTVEEAREVKFQAECAGRQDIVDDLNVRLSIMQARNFPSAKQQK